MELNEIHNEGEHASVSLKVIVLVFAVVLVGALSYFVWDAQNTAIDTTDYSTPIVTKTVETTPETTTEPETKTETKAVSNIVKYSDSRASINLQFELPEGYGAANNTGAPSGSTTFYIGKYSSDNKDNVIIITLSIPTYVKIIPSFNKDIVTLKDWQNKEGYSLDPSSSDLISTVDISIAGVTAKKYELGGAGHNYLIQFVVNKNFYEIRYEVGQHEDAITKIIETFKFID